MAGTSLAGNRSEDAVLIAYRLGSSDPKKASRFVQSIFGAPTSTEGRRYHRKGLMDEVPHWRVIRGVVLVRPSDRARVVRELRQWTSEVHWWTIRLRRTERRRLQVKVGHA
ncbi:hypothetical protein B1B_13871 [mine drainage metagenome]|uniref:Uncharacterized protein n=1 Tax=mine drainage metagenome TaxID=410659 RepID=T0ZE62_9ZZZZ